MSEDIPPSRTVLTVREAFAMAAMQGLLAGNDTSPVDIARRAANYADELIAALMCEGE